MTTIRFDLDTSDGGPVADPELKVTVVQHSSGGQLVKRDAGMYDSELREMKDFETERSSGDVMVIIKSEVYLNTNTQKIFNHPDGDLHMRVPLFRKSSLLAPEFTAWNGLPEHFLPLKKVLGQSRNLLVRERNGQTLFETIPLFTEGAFDNFSVHRIKAETLEKAKAALLNIYGKMLLTPIPEESPMTWFDFIEKILLIDNERLVAAVREVFRNRLRRILQRSLPGYRTVSAKEHIKNVPDAVRDRYLKDRITSKKSDENLGNLQLTLIPADSSLPPDSRPPDIVDIDIDEHGNFFDHLRDVIFKHPKSGGTHPYHVREILGVLYSDVDLGYELNPA